MEFTELEKKYRNFYAPTYELKVENKNVLEKGVEIASVSVDHSLDSADQVTFTINNAFDIAKRELNWLDELIAFGKKVEVRMGYVDKLQQMFVGLITSVRTSFPSGGLPQLEVSGYDLSHCMMKGKKSRSWNKVKDSDIARTIASEYNLEKGNVEETQVEHTKVKQNEESDFDVLKRLAERNGFELFVFGEKLYFRLPANDETAVVTLEWGKSLLSFSPELNIADQVTEVEVRGWNVKTKWGRNPFNASRIGAASSSSGTSTSALSGKPKTLWLFMPSARQAHASSLSRTSARSFGENSGESPMEALSPRVNVISRTSAPSALSFASEPPGP